MLKRFLEVLSMLIVLSVGALAQEAGQIVGAVRDQSGAVVAGARVTATETGTGFAQTTTSSSSGDFVLPNLRPTMYVISAEATQTLANAGATQGDITSGGPRIIQLALKLVF